MIKETPSNSLFSTIVSQQNAKVAVHKKKNVILRRKSIVVSLAGLSPKNRNMISFGKQGSESSLALLAQNLKSSQKDVKVSELYIPSDQRVFKTQLQNKQKKIKQKQVQFELANLIDVMQELQKQEEEQKKAKAKKEKSKKTATKKIRRKASFSDGQLKYKDIWKLQNPLRGRKGHTIKEQNILKKMVVSKRYPLPDTLLHAPKDFDLFVDSIITQGYGSDDQSEWINYKQEVDVPNNSFESLEEFDFDSSSEDAFDLIPMPINKHHKKELKAKPARVVKESLNLHGFDTEQLLAYPHQYIEGNMPLDILRDSLRSNFKNFQDEVGSRLAEEFLKKEFFPSLEHLQLAYEHYCQEFACQPLKLEMHFENKTFTLKNQLLPISQVKALAQTIPIMGGLKSIIFHNNRLQDEGAVILLFACFMNPDIQNLQFSSQILGSSFGFSYFTLSQIYVDKVFELNIKNSMHLPDLPEYVTRDMFKLNQFSSLNVSGIPLSANACRDICKYLIQSTNLRSLDVSQCKIQLQSTRYLIDGLNRNQGLQYFNFANNEMQSSVYEFSIKIAKILTRHEHLMHMDLTSTGLRKEEVLFIGMAVSSSKSCIGLHLSGNNLDYYERIYLRTLTNAKVAYHFRNMADELGSIRSQKERNQINELRGHDFDSKDLREFVKQWNFIDQQRLGLDEEINAILKDLDVTDIFRQLKKGNKTKAESNLMLQELIQKIEQRIEEIQKMKKIQEDEVKKQIKNIQMDDPLASMNLNLYNFDEEGNSPQKPPKDLKDLDNEGQDLWVMQNALKIDRIKKRLDDEQNRKKRAKSAGELALLFMGINKIAYDLLLENPMTGYMNDIIFSRVLGCDEVEQGYIWRDCSQCYVCEKWNKETIIYSENDHLIMKQNIQKLGELHEVLAQCVDLTNKNLIKKVPQTEIKKMFEDHEQRRKIEIDQTNIQNNKNGADFDDSSQKQLDEQIQSVSHQSTQEQIQEEKDFEIGNIISPIKFDNLKAQNLLTNAKATAQDLLLSSVMQIADNQIKKEIEEGTLVQVSSDESDLESYKKEQRQVKLEEKLKKEGKLNQYKKEQAARRRALLHGKKESEKESQVLDDESQQESQRNKILKLKEAQLLSNNSTETEERSQSVKSQKRKKKQKKKTPILIAPTIKRSLRKKVQIEEEEEPQPEKKQTKLVKRTIFFQGAAFIIEEEISIDTESSSNITSNDSFEVDDQGVKDQLCERLIQQKIEVSEDVKKKVADLQAILDKNIPKQTVNLFGRKQIFLVASWNDWSPVVMKTIYEINLEKTKGKDLQEHLAQNKDSALKSKKKDLNIIQYTNFIPPGKHLFYYVYQNQYIFLSPKYDIVRFKSTNLLLNQIKVRERTKPLVQVTLGRNVYTVEAVKFNKEKSVFKDFQEDTPEFLKKMLEKDLEYGKIHKLCKSEEDLQQIKDKLFEHYLAIKNTFLYLASISTYPTLGFNDCTEFVRRSNLFDKQINLSRMDQQMVATNVSNNKYKSNAERELHRYEFVEFIVRMGKIKYLERKNATDLVDSTQIILKNDILPNNPKVDGLNFREEHMYNLKVDEIFRKNAISIQKLYDEHINPNKRYMTLDECTKLAKKAGLQIAELRMKPCYSESLMSKIDTMSDQSVLQQMRYVEFLVFISRIAYEVYKEHKNNGWRLHLKIDKVLTAILESHYIPKLFSFAETEIQDQFSESSEEVIDDNDDGMLLEDENEKSQNAGVNSPQNISVSDPLTAK